MTEPTPDRTTSTDPAPTKQAKPSGMTKDGKPYISPNDDPTTQK